MTLAAQSSGETGPSDKWLFGVRPPPDRMGKESYRKRKSWFREITLPRLGNVLNATTLRNPVASYSFLCASVKGSSLKGRLGKKEGKRRQTIGEFCRCEYCCPQSSEAIRQPSVLSKGEAQKLFLELEETRTCPGAVRSDADCSYLRWA